MNPKTNLGVSAKCNSAKQSLLELNDTFATAFIDDLIGSDIDFIKEDVSILFYLN
jgi:hypothetical protein